MIILEIKWKEGFRKHKFEILTVWLCSVLLASAVYALTYLWSAPTAATITTAVQNIVVLDSEGNEVTSISFGNVVPSSSVEILLTINNTSPNATITINWSSTLKDTTNKITDSWQWYRYDSWYGWYWTNFPATLAPGTSIETKYKITIASDCPLQTFSWTLYIVPG